MTVYIDELAAVNFILDYLVLWGAALVSGRRMCRWRTVLAAGLGSAYAVICAVLAWGPALWLPTKIAVGLLMCAVAFGFWRFWRTAGWFFAISAGLAGGVYALSAFSGGRYGFLSGAVYLRLPTVWLLALSGAVWLGLTALTRLPGVKAAVGAKKRRVKICCGEKQAETDVLVDTGCFMRDPVDNGPVLVVSAAVAKAVLPEAVGREMGRKPPSELVLTAREVQPRLIFTRGVTGGELVFAFRAEVGFDGGAPVTMTVAVSENLDADGIAAIVGEL